ncbi:MAG: tetratricopeptide repeat protein, partial [Anaerolineae bacterium]
MTEVLLRDYVEEMREHLREGRFSQVLALGNHILSFYPKHLETYRLLAETNLEMNELDAAENLFNRVRSADPENLVAFIGLSIIHEHRSQIDEAIWHLERAFEIQSSNGELRRELLRLYESRDGTRRTRFKLTQGALARLYARQGLYGQAIQELHALLRAEPDRLDLQVALAEAFYREGRKQDSAQIARSILDQLPFCLKANLLLGALWAENGVPESQTLLKRAQALDPDGLMARELRIDYPHDDSAPTLPALEGPAVSSLSSAEQMGLGSGERGDLFGPPVAPAAPTPSPARPLYDSAISPDTIWREQSEEASDLIRSASETESQETVPWLQNIYRSGPAPAAPNSPPPDAEPELTLPWLEHLQAIEQAEGSGGEPPAETAAPQETAPQ